MDYSFSGLNAETLSWAPREAIQFGRALQRIFTKILKADPRDGAVHMAKIDAADGFYRVWVRLDDVPKLGVAVPTTPGSPPLIAFPLALPMGWVESPPYFTAATETICDLANAALASRDAPHLWQHHRLEAVAATPPEASEHPPRRLQHRYRPFRPPPPRERPGCDPSDTSMSTSTTSSCWLRRPGNGST